MQERIWDRFLTERDKKTRELSGLGKRAGFGERPALMIIDVNYDFLGDKPESVLQSIGRWRFSCGEDGWIAVPKIRKLIDIARAKGLPIIYTTSIRRPDEWDDGSWQWKNSRTGENPIPPPGIESTDIVKDIAPSPIDLLIRKQKPSAFFGTNLASYLVLLKADSLIVTGTTTSGCVRATVLDAFSYNYRTTVVEDACFDRIQASHAINLFDMHSKYSDVVHSDEVAAYMNSLSAGMFELPTGAAPSQPRVKQSSVA